jgi:hypothetical protein
MVNKYQLMLEDADGNPAVATDTIVQAMNENKHGRELPGFFRNDANGLQYITDENLESLVAEGKLRVLADGEPGYIGNKTTYLIEEIGEDLDGGVYNALFSVDRDGGRRRRKTRKPKRKTRKTRRGVSRR